MPEDDLTKELALHAGKGLIDKLLGFATGFLSIKTINKRGEARKAEKLIDVDIENAARLKTLEGDLEVEKKKIDNEFAVQAHREQVKNNYLPVPRIPTVWSLGDYDIEIADIQPSLLKPLEQRRAFNILTVVSEAAKVLPEHGPIPVENINPDVAIRIIEVVKDVSDEYMQKLWAKLLAGEIATPGRFSLRTLDVVKNLTSMEAQVYHRTRSAFHMIPLVPLRGQSLAPEVFHGTAYQDSTDPSRVQMAAYHRRMARERFERARVLSNERSQEPQDAARMEQQAQ